MDKKEHCEYLFNSIENIAQELEDISKKVRMLKGSVQNPNSISYEDFYCFQDTCVLINEEMEKTFNRVRNSLKSVYEQVDYIYNGE